MRSIDMTAIRRNPLIQVVNASPLSLPSEIRSKPTKYHSVQSAMPHCGAARVPQHNQYCRVPRLGQPQYLTLIILMISFLSLTATASSPADAGEDGGVGFGSTLAEYAKSGIILVDPNPLPVAWQSRLELRSEIHEGDLHDRDADPIHLVERKESKTATATSLVVATTAATAAALPSAFDSGIGTSFSSKTCPEYINSFLDTTEFKACMPFSLLLESSNSFFQAEKSIVRITQVLDAACAVNVTDCNNYMSTLANNLTASGNCGSDYENGNSIVQEIHVGLLSYETLYQASCLKNPSTGSYCFADAITNSSSPTDSYIYYLPVNTSLPGGTNPTCDTCLQNTMAVFQAAAANTTLPVSPLYVPAAEEINIVCGSNFVNATIPLAKKLSTTSSAAVPPHSYKTSIVALLMLVVALLL